MKASLRANPVVGERMKTVGVDWGPKGIILVHRHGEWGVYKIPGRGSNHPTRYGIVKIEQLAPEKDSIRWGRIGLIYKSEVEPGAAWRSAIADLEREVRALVAGEINYGKEKEERKPEAES